MADGSDQVLLFTWYTTRRPGSQATTVVASQNITPLPGISIRRQDGPTKRQHWPATPDYRRTGSHYIEERYGWDHKNPTYDQLRQYVLEAWEALPDSFLQELLAQMP
ncbi:hypothetical protein VTK56DRAFT_6178 [Thermocarpiscus australiensis]